MEMTLIIFLTVVITVLASVIAILGYELYKLKKNINIVLWNQETKISAITGKMMAMETSISFMRNEKLNKRMCENEQSK